MKHEHAKDPKVLARLRSAEGHVRGIAKMVEEDAYCIDVVHQIQAAQRALERVKGMVLEGHLRSCATRVLSGENAAERERVIGEIVDVIAAQGRG
jgi:DNA-binding FrmR family transcriptional regulator